MRLLPSAQAIALLLVSISGGINGNAIGAPEGADSVRAISTTQAIQPNKVECDLAKWQARARIVLVSSGAVGFGIRMIDNDAQTLFRFSGNDLHPTVVVELAGEEPLNRVSAIFSNSENVALDVYLLAQLPKNFSQIEGSAIRCLAETANPNNASADFAPANARFAVFRWTRAKPSTSPFWVAEVSAFSNVRAEEIPLFFAENEIHFTNETHVDFSNKLGTMADPPSVDIISP